MLDLKFMRENKEQVEKWLKQRGSDLTLDEFAKLDEERREILGEVEALKNKRNNESAEIARLKKAKEDASELIKAMGEVSAKIKELDEKLAEVDEKIKYIQMTIPNKLSETTPIGKDEDENVEIRRWGEPRKFDFEPKSHWEIGEQLGILDFERGSKLSGSRFVLYRGGAARVERALINFMLDLHTEKHGYTEHITPFLVNGTKSRGKAILTSSTRPNWANSTRVSTPRRSSPVRSGRGAAARCTISTRITTSI